MCCKAKSSGIVWWATHGSTILHCANLEFFRIQCLATWWPARSIGETTNTVGTHVRKKTFFWFWPLTSVSREDGGGFVNRYLTCLRWPVGGEKASGGLAMASPGAGKKPWFSLRVLVFVIGNLVFPCVCWLLSSEIIDSHCVLLDVCISEKPRQNFSWFQSREGWQLR